MCLRQVLAPSDVGVPLNLLKEDPYQPSETGEIVLYASNLSVVFVSKESFRDFLVFPLRPYIKARPDG